HQVELVAVEAQERPDLAAERTLSGGHGAGEQQLGERQAGQRVEVGLFVRDDEAQLRGRLLEGDAARAGVHHGDVDDAASTLERLGLPHAGVAAAATALEAARHAHASGAVVFDLHSDGRIVGQLDVDGAAAANEVEQHVRALVYA